MKRDIHGRSLIAGVCAGFAVWIAVGGIGFVVLRTAWSSYAIAEPTKSYTLPMLISRLVVGVVCTITAGACATIGAKRSRAASWWLGGLLLLISAPIHLWRVWADYPPWYHFAYLVSLMPLAVLGGVLMTMFGPQAAPQVTQARNS